MRVRLIADIHHVGTALFIKMRQAIHGVIGTCFPIDHLITVLIRILLIFSLAFPTARAAELPDLGEVSRKYFSDLDEQALSRTIMRDVYADPQYLDDPEVEAYLEQLGYRLVSVSSRNQRDFNFFVIQEPTVNAFALPGGNIGVHSGLLLTAQNESELASVLGHEIAHVTQDHIARMIASQTQSYWPSIAALGIALLAARSNPQVANAAIVSTQALSIQNQLNYTREYEREADRIGYEMLKQAKFDPHGMASFFNKLQRTNRLYDTSAPAYLRTHPLTSERIADMQARSGQKIVGVARFTRTLSARAGRWSVEPDRIGYQWRRNGEDIKGATGRRYEIRPEDVGARIRVTVTARAPGYKPLSVTTDRTGRVRHRVDVRRVVRYHLETRGHITTSVPEFARLAQETFDDPRGWRGAGIEFRRVPRGGAFTLVLSEARFLPSFSSVCSTMWSCRVGRYVIINQERWKHASPAWNAANLALRDYRHMVVNHETGHWLGLGHAGCPGPGRLAPVMMQQSKGLQGCRFNPFPTAGELARRTPHGRVMADEFGRGYPQVQSE